MFSMDLESENKQLLLLLLRVGVSVASGDARHYTLYQQYAYISHKGGQ